MVYRYDAQYRKTGTSTWTYVENIGAEPWTLAGLDPQTEYESQFRIYDTDTQEIGDWSSSVVETTAGTVPGGGGGGEPVHEQTVVSSMPTWGKTVTLTLNNVKQGSLILVQFAGLDHSDWVVSASNGNTVDVVSATPLSDGQRFSGLYAIFPANAGTTVITATTAGASTDGVLIAREFSGSWPTTLSPIVQTATAPSTNNHSIGPTSAPPAGAALVVGTTVSSNVTTYSNVGQAPIGNPSSGNGHGGFLSTMFAYGIGTDLGAQTFAYSASDWRAAGLKVAVFSTATQEQSASVSLSVDHSHSVDMSAQLESEWSDWVEDEFTASANLVVNHTQSATISYGVAEFVSTSLSVDHEHSVAISYGSTESVSVSLTVDHTQFATASYSATELVSTSLVVDHTQSAGLVYSVSGPPVVPVLTGMTVTVDGTSIISDNYELAPQF